MLTSRHTNRDDKCAAVGPGAALVCHTLSGDPDTRSLTGRCDAWDVIVGCCDAWDVAMSCFR